MKELKPLVVDSINSSAVHFRTGRLPVYDESNECQGKMVFILYVYFTLQCSTYGCLLELTIQLSVVMLGKQFLNNCVELGVP